MSTIENRIEMNLAEATALVAQAKAEQKAKQREDLIAQLAVIREQLRTARARYKELRTQVCAERAERTNAQTKVLQQDTRIADSWSQRPRVADVLPSDPDVVAWRKKHEALEARRDQLIRERDQLPNPERLINEAGAFEGQYGTIGTLEFTEANLLRQIEGGSGIVRVEGGVSGGEVTNRVRRSLRISGNRKRVSGNGV